MATSSPTMMSVPREMSQQRQRGEPSLCGGSKSVQEARKQHVMDFSIIINEQWPTKREGRDKIWWVRTEYVKICADLCC